MELRNSESEVIDFAKSLSDEVVEGEEIEFSVENSEIVLFVAAESGNGRFYPRLNFNLSGKTYKISTIEREDEQTSVICHHFREKI